MKLRSVYLETYFWRDKTLGNTYFSSRIYANGNLLGALPLQYGHERMDEHQALGLLIELGYVAKDATSSIWKELEKLGVDFYQSRQYVTRGDARKHGELMDFEVSKCASLIS